MQIQLLNNNRTSFLIFIIFIYLFKNTGIQGDEYFAINEFYQSDNFNRFISLKEDVPMQHIFALTDYYLRWWIYYVFLDNVPVVYDVGKVFFNLICIYFVYLFFTIFFNYKSSLLLSLSFILFPNHEATAFTYMTILHVLGPSSLMFCYYLIHNNKKFGYFILYPSCFLTYANPPFMLGISFLFLLQKKYKKFILFSIPCLFYLIFYVIIKLNFPGVEKRIDLDIDFYQLIKNITLQLITLFDTFFGPSFFIKVFYAIKEISLTSFLISMFLTLVIIFDKSKPCKTNKIKDNKKILILSGFIIVISSILMFSFTGLYNYTSFNHGNRVNIYFCFFVIILFGIFLNYKLQKIVFIFLIIFPFFGLSDHWKKWNFNHSKIINNIKKLNLSEIKHDDLILVKGNNFSKIGRIAHIEFFEMPWHTKSIFDLKHNFKNTYPITNSLVFYDDYIFDKKYNKNITVKKYVYVYNTEKNTLNKFSYDINFLNNLKPNYKRHWIQIINNKFINQTIVFLSPRLEYLLFN